MFFLPLQGVNLKTKFLRANTLLKDVLANLHTVTDHLAGIYLFWLHGHVRYLVMHMPDSITNR